MEFVKEEAKTLPVIHETDVVVIGGGCTGVCAAVRAARLGARVTIVERSNCFGGVATNGYVCVWHALTDTTMKRPIIGGLTAEIIERLKNVPNGIRLKMPPEGAPFREPNYSIYHINTEELKIELDRLLIEAGVTLYLHTLFAAPYCEDGRLAGVIVENASGRGVIRGNMFIDASADGFLGAAMGMETYTHGAFQPATTAAKVQGWGDLTEPSERLHTAENQKRIGARAGWDDPIPGSNGVYNWYKSQFVGNCADADTLTRGEIEGRRQVREMMNILREQDPRGKELVLLGLSSVIGVRETRQLRCSYQLKGEDVSFGRAFDDAIGYCAYPMDIHTPSAPTRLRYLDGYERVENKMVRWRQDDGPRPTYWQIPFRCMLPMSIGNLLIAGRAIDADRDAFAAVRVMISLNQTGEAAGVAAALALQEGKTVQELDMPTLRRAMQSGGSILPTF